MDYQLINNIQELSEETLVCLKLLEREFQLFMFDEEDADELSRFISMMKLKAIRIANPRTSEDISKNIKRKAVKYEWDRSKFDD